MQADGGTVKRILALVLLVAICVGGFLRYQKYKKDKALTDGSYTCVGCLPPDKAVAYEKYDRGEGPDPEVGRNATPSQSANQASQSVSASANPAGYASTSQDASQATPVIIPAGSTSLARSQAVTPINSPAPTTDSIPANPQNGLHYGGSGSYQWYREGNLTWRVDTQTGTSCIIYATMEEWRKRIVMDHGCGRNA